MRVSPLYPPLETAWREHQPLYSPSLFVFDFVIEFQKFEHQFMLDALKQSLASRVFECLLIGFDDEFVA